MAGLFGGKGLLGLGRSQEKLDYKLQKKQMKLDSRDYRQANRNMTRQTAYVNGIDPNKAWSGTVSSLGQSASSAVSSIFGKGSPFGSNSEGDFLGNNDGKGIPTWLVIVGLALLIFSLMTRRK